MRSNRVLFYALSLKNDLLVFRHSTPSFEMKYLNPVLITKYKERKLALPKINEHNTYKMKSIAECKTFDLMITLKDEGTAQSLMRILVD